MKLRKIESDLYDISGRLKEIDKSYYLVFNVDLARYEVHCTDENGRGTLCLVSPYGHLDARLLDLVRATRRERAKKIYAEIEKNNAKLREAQLKRELTRCRDTLKDIVKFAGGRDLALAETEYIRGKYT